MKFGPLQPVGKRATFFPLRNNFLSCALFIDCNADKY